MTALKWLLLIAVVGYGGVLGLMYVFQRALMYFPDPTRTPPAAAGLPQAQEVTLTSGDGEKLIAWYVPPKGTKPLIIYFHGNAGALDLRAGRFKWVIEDGTGLLALSYRGYGGSTGKPTEDGLINDARAAYAFAADRYPRIALWGESLGTGVAVALAAEKPVTRMVLDAPYTSALDLARANHWYLPVRLLMKDQFRSDQRIARVKAPVLIMHGEVDQIIPIAYGERLFAMIPGPKQFVRFPGGYHVDLDRHGGAEAALKFLGETTD